MAANGTSAQDEFAPVLAALATMQSSGEPTKKKEAHSFLEQFQKSSDAWQTIFSILSSQNADVQAKLFATTTLKGKIVYDLHQLPRSQLPSLRDTLLNLLSTFSSGPKPMRLQLCVCLVNLAIQMVEWKDVLQLVVATLGNDSQQIACVLDFLRVLPEEVTEGRKINLTEDELNERTKELLEDNVHQVLTLLIQYSQSSASAAKDPQLLECITSWSKEVSVNELVKSPLLKIVIDGLSSDSSFEAAVECICAIFAETRDVDECVDAIQILFPHIVSLRPKISQAAKEEDHETFKGVSRIFAEAGEMWVPLIARMPQQFRPLVEAILEAAALDKERDAISLTFNFWYELKQLITLDNFMEARMQFIDIFSKLVDIMISHLAFPKSESGTDDLFDGDRELEEKFREFRHQMGDVLKDCCEVLGVTQCLEKTYVLIDSWVKTYGGQAIAGNVPEWQSLEAPLFSLRAMGRMVSADENIILPRLMPLLVQIPDHEKVRFQTVMALGRYTEWTAQHPDLLQPQLTFIMAAFEHNSKEVVRAAALSFKFFCNDCADLLKGFSTQLQHFYANVLDKLPVSSQDEVTDGVASVVSRLPTDEIYQNLKLYCDPVINTLLSMAQSAADDEAKLAIADRLQLITIFIQWVQPYVESSQENPAVKYCQEIFPVLAAVAEGFADCIPVLERVCRCWRYMVLSYRTSILPLLPQLAEKLVAGFAASRQGCFLWATDSIMREFSEGQEFVQPHTVAAVYQFYEQQATNFLRALSEVPPEELPDLIEDFFRLSSDVVRFYPQQTVLSTLMGSIVSAACSALSLLKEEPLIATIHFVRDLLSHAGEMSPSSSFDQERRTNPTEIRARVRQLLDNQGEQLVQRVMTGMMYSFPRDCIPDASGVLLQLFELVPQQVALWLQNTVASLPEGSMTEQEKHRLLTNINNRVQSNEMNKVRSLLQDFTNSYRRRNVAPREGLGRLEATRFRFSG
ncbi:ARM repeat-containing protein [Pseudovirgaria hyperparasitica]|uniref:ARM repeat-containing protein n=1 Tax=Pseudovirgaria hyperparasitica TaxID=470096 RepID=A0A6A6WLU6_9PEZI|nr:ARM repeat-containing protein [Pseudovirgaria hyperparasitica]KAF2763128.1 ARM repeat-containing protein [Pseudovirgaria hyperparasitica]